MSNPSSRRRSLRFFLTSVLLLTLLGAGLYAVWHWFGRGPDMAAVLQSNSRGVAHMDRYEFQEAATAFEEVVKLAPDWRPGRINLAIALINVGRDPARGEGERKALFERVKGLLEGVLKEEPDNPYANYCLGFLHLEFGSDWARAGPYFAKVVEKDPNDAFGWYFLGQCEQENAERALECFRKAVQLDPYHTAALHGLQGKLGELGRRDEAKKIMDEEELLRLHEVLTPTGATKFYAERGRYGQVIGWVPPSSPPAIGPLPVFENDEKFRVELAEGARWATAADFGTGPVADVRRRVRERFGAVMVALDYDGDGRPDLLLLAAVVEKGQVRDLLLHNEGDGHFKDTTAAAGLATSRPSLGCCVADFNNDGHPDLLITGVGEQHLFRNTGKGTFEDVTKTAGLDKLTTVCLGATMIDLEQDGDLDLVLSQYAETPEKALAALDGKTADAGGVLVVYWNVGEAQPVNRGTDPPPLPTAFRRADGPAGLLGPSAAVVGTPFTDLDNDHDIDLVILADGTAPAMALNDRVQRFHRADWPEVLLPRARWNGALVLDVNNDDHSDLLFVGPDQKPVLLVSTAADGESDPARWFRQLAIDSPALLQAQALDLDLDGWTDAIGLSRERKPVFLHNKGKTLALAPEALGPDNGWPKDLIAVLATDLDCDANPDLVLWSEADGLQVRHNRGNGNRGLKISVTGHRRVEPPGGVVRCNADGLGVRITVQARDIRTGTEVATLSAGLGQSAQPVLLGIGRNNEADILRLYWPDYCQQAEFNVPAEPVCRIVRIEETNRKLDSCPVLFTWDGKQYVFVTDFLGAGSVGEPDVEGGHRPPRPEESVKIEPEQLAPREGKFVLKIAEPMNEVTYLDRLQLVVLDHPADVRVFPDERFHTGGPPPTQELFAFRSSILPRQVHDHRGRDVTAKLTKWDRDTVDEFARRSWIGFAEEHSVTLDFGDQLARFGPKDRLVLFLAGWTDYAYPESILAAHQAGVEMMAPILERRTSDGKWEKVAEAGLPAGLPRMMTLEVTGQLGGPVCVLRLRTNLCVYWDQIFVASVSESVKPHLLEVADATLSARGVMKEFSPDGREPTIYDYNRLDSWPLTRLSGKMTRFGDVTELLRTTDDRFVIFGPGDELTARFDATQLPPLSDGWKRSYVLKTWGFCKDSGPYTALGGKVEPLPFRAMSNYPYKEEEKHPDPEYQRKWNTRQVGKN